jgi:Flp pilus assembly protein TadG
MMQFLRNILRSQKGASILTVAVAIAAIFGFAILAIDLSLIQLAKSQLQNAADAAALAGAIGLATSGGNQDVATAEAIRLAGLNLAVQDMQRSVVIGAGDVVFPQPNQVTVTTHRTKATNDPVTLFFMKVIDPLLDNQGEITARATAEISFVCGTDCLRPFCPPDRWEDADNDSIWDPADEYDDLNVNGVWDVGEPLTEDHNGNGVWDPAEFYDPELTGYKAPDDIGVSVRLKLRNSNKDFRAGWYYAVRFGPINTGDPVESGADPYREWIMACSPYTVSIGDLLELENGVMQGPTVQGLGDLIDLDPTAEWDPVTGTVVNSIYPTSPRVIKVPAFDPTLGVRKDIPGPGYTTITKFLALFIEGHDGSDVIGRFMKTITEGTPGSNCAGGFLFTVTLVE